jgi:hypothetical protein
MNIPELERKLLAAAKACTPSDAVPYGFERRVMTRLSGRPMLDVWANWSRALWRAAATCMAVAMLLGLWAAYSTISRSSRPNLSDDLEQTVFVAVTHDTDSIW